MSELIEPRVLKGFRDFLPDAEIERKLLIEKLEHTFRSQGFVPIDTPVLEYAEILLGKGGGETEKQVYRFNHHDRDLAMRFDLTVPFARFMAEHVSELYLPFKRYHIAKVWRGENTQRGRYREFMQCDFDIVGADSVGADLEILILMYKSMLSLGVSRSTIHFSHRGLFNRFLALINASDKSVDILRTVDKLDKIGEAAVLEILVTHMSKENAEKVLTFIKAENSFEETILKLEGLTGGESEESKRVRAVYAQLSSLGIQDHFMLDPAITRGLDYYTGIVFETLMDDLKELGSVCSGGRYNDLASLYTKEKLPGVGASVGLDRLLAGLEALKMSNRKGSFSDALILCMDETLFGYYHKLADTLSKKGITTEVFPDKKKLNSQFTFAEKKSIPFAFIIGSDEVSADCVTIKHLASRETKEKVSLDEAIAFMKDKQEN